MMLCHGTDGGRHAPTSFEEVQTDMAGHTNLECPNCGVLIEADETIARMVME